MNCVKDRFIGKLTCVPSVEPYVFCTNYEVRIQIRLYSTHVAYIKMTYYGFFFM